MESKNSSDEDYGPENLPRGVKERQIYKGDYLLQRRGYARKYKEVLEGN